MIEPSVTNFCKECVNKNRELSEAREMIEWLREMMLNDDQSVAIKAHEWLLRNEVQS